MKKIVIFGAGKDGRRALKWFPKEKVNCFVDNNVLLHETYVDDVQVISFQKMLEKTADNDIVIATEKYKEEIARQLFEAGICNAWTFGEYFLKMQFERCEDDKRRILLMNTHTFTNVGDHAISEAEIYFIRKYLSEYDLIEIPSTFCYSEKKYLKKQIKETDILLITGGGFLGSLWMGNGENTVRDILQEFPDNRIIILPQTIYFENTEEGERQKHISSDIYNKHQHLFVCLRDMNSYQLAEEMFDSHVILRYIPDVVTLFNKSDKKVKRNGIGLCLRMDKESVLSEEDRKYIDRVLQNTQKSIIEFSMHATDEVSVLERAGILEEKIEMVQSCELVVTDRLHCMLLCAISGTPCIATNNLSGKVKGVYEWIKDNRYIKYAERITELEWCIKEVKDEDFLVYENGGIELLYRKLAKEIKEF